MKRMIMVESDSNYNLLQAYELVEAGLEVNGDKLYKKVGDDCLFYESGSEYGVPKFYGKVNALMVPKGKIEKAPQVKVVEPEPEPQAGIVADALAAVERVELKQRIAETVVETAEAWDKEEEL